MNEAKTVSGHVNRRSHRLPGVGRRCRFAAGLAVGIVVCAGARAEDTLSVATWGGAYGQSQEIAYFEPFAKETGARIATEVYDGTLAKIKEMIGGTESNVDVVDVSAAALNTLCSRRAAQPHAASDLPASATA